MAYRIIAAVERNSGIGYKGGMPWNIPNDMREFSKLTRGKNNHHNAVIMGRTTWLSLAGNPLKGRDNIVLSRDPKRVPNINYTAGVATSIPDVIDMCSNRTYNDIWVIGGADIYRQFLNYNICVSCHITEIDANYLCDTFFPMDLLENDWTIKYTRLLGDNPLIKQHIIVPTNT